MNKANECTCPSGDGSLVHPCPAHPAVEQACWDERKLSDLGNELHNLSCSIVHENEKLAEQIGGIARELWNWPQARAALAQPSPASDLDPLNLAPHAEAFNEAPAEALKPEPAEADRPEVVAWQYRVTAGPQTGWSLWHPGKGEEFERSYTVERRPLMTVAQHERIVGELRAVIAQLRQHKNDYMDSGQETYRALQNEIREREAEIARLDGLVSGRTAERDTALTKVAELEKELEMARDAASKGDAARHAACGMEMDIQELKAKLADAQAGRQAGRREQSAYELLRQALKLMPLGTKKRAEWVGRTSDLLCIAQAQHSVPDGVTVNPEALRQVVRALVGPAHHIRELQVTASLPGSPITELVKQYNAWAAGAPGKEGA
ncbi:hypothetical protein ACM7GB_26840 [Pseudomonas aeruginosa]